jgi:hypothetical protein
VFRAACEQLKSPSCQSFRTQKPSELERACQFGEAVACRALGL